MQKHRSGLMALLATLILAGVLASHAHAQPQQGTVENTLRLVPADAHAAVIVPNLKRLSDEITQLLEGMDRAEFLLGTRPIDQLKACTGFNVGVNDNGGLALVMTGERENEPIWALLVPVTDPQAFLDGNFPQRENDQVRLPDGRILHTRNLQTHVLLSRDEQAARQYEPGEGAAQALRQTLGQRGVAIMDSGEAFLFGRQQALRWAAGAAQRGAAMGGVPLPGPGAAMPAPPEDVEIGLIALDFDALGLISRSLVRFREGTPVAAISPAPPQARTQALGRLPNKPFYFAKSVDVQAFGGAEGVRAFVTALGLPQLADQLPQWLTNAQGFQFAAYPSPAGLAGGILNDALLVVQTQNPEQTKQAIQADLQRLQEREDHGFRWRVGWEPQRRINEQLGMAAAYEVSPVQTPEEDFIFPIVWQNLFGRAGWRGFVHQTQDSVIMTFSQRPAVLEAAMRARDEAALMQMPAIRTMQTMFPPNAAVQGHLGVGQFLDLLRQVAEGFGQPDVLPEVDQDLPPVGFAAAPVERGLETATILPSPVLAFVVDMALQGRAMGFDDDFDDDDFDMDEDDIDEE